MSTSSSIARPAARAERLASKSTREGVELMKLLRTLGCAVLTLGISSWLAAAPATAQGYEVIDLGTADGEPGGINTLSQVAGGASNAASLFHAFVWENDVMRDLGTLGGLYSQGEAINARGSVAGISTTAAGDFHAFLSVGGLLRDVDGRAGRYSEAHAINASDVLAGVMETTLNAGVYHAFILDNNVMRDLGTLGGSYSEARAINAAGQVVGSSSSRPGTAEPQHAFLWVNGQFIDLGTLPEGRWSIAFGINDNGQIVGTAETAEGSFAAVTWNQGPAVRLQGLSGGFQSDASAINAIGQIVGSAVTASLERHAVLWDASGIKDLNLFIPANSGWLLNWATAINDAGRIVGFGSHNGQERLFLLVPR